MKIQSNNNLRIYNYKYNLNKFRNNKYSNKIILNNNIKKINKFN